jgi:hypothetical protein
MNQSLMHFIVHLNIQIQNIDRYTRASTGIILESIVSFESRFEFQMHGRQRLQLISQEHALGKRKGRRCMDIFV